MPYNLITEDEKVLVLESKYHIYTIPKDRVIGARGFARTLLVQRALVEQGQVEFLRVKAERPFSQPKMILASTLVGYDGVDKKEKPGQVIEVIEAVERDELSELREELRKQGELLSSLAKYLGARG